MRHSVRYRLNPDNLGGIYVAIFWSSFVAAQLEIRLIDRTTVVSFFFFFSRVKLCSSLRKATQVKNDVGRVTTALCIDFSPRKRRFKSGMLPFAAVIAVLPTNSSIPS